MREILFRGKRVDNGEWVYGDLRHCKFSDEEPYTVHIVDNSDGMNNSVCGLEVIPETVGQYTGLTDMNGRKIFEGDIVEFFPDDNLRKPNEHSYYAIRWHDAGFVIVDEHGRTDDFDTFFSERGGGIGSIHDNPELLEVSE